MTTEHNAHLQAVRELRRLMRTTPEQREPKMTREEAIQCLWAAYDDRGCMGAGRVLRGCVSGFGMLPMGDFFRFDATTRSAAFTAFTDCIRYGVRNTGLSQQQISSLPYLESENA